MKYYSTLFKYKGRLGCQEWIVDEDSKHLHYLEAGQNHPKAVKSILSKLSADPEDVEFLGIENFSCKADMEHYTNTVISKRTPGRGFNG